MEAKMTVHCCLCSKKTHAPFEIPDEWALTRDEFDIEQDGFCPDHAAVAEFESSQCSGCVGGWGDCDMWRAFAFSGSRSITDRDLSSIERGICPRRTNGTFSFSRGTGIEDIDLSTRANEGGRAFADAIREYIVRYPPS